MAVPACNLAPWGRRSRGRRSCHTLVAMVQARRSQTKPDDGGVMTESAEAPVPRVSLLRPARGRLLIALGLAWLSALLGAGAVIALGRIVDHAITGESVTALLLVVAALLASRALIAAPSPMLSATTATTVERDLRHRVLDAVLVTRSWSGRRTGDVVSKATEGIEAVGSLAGTFVPNLLAGMSVPLLLCLVIATIDLPTALVLVLVLPLIPLLLRMLERRFASVSSRYRATADILAARFLDGIQGLRTLKALDRADAYGDDIADESERLRVETMRLLRVNQLALLAVDSLFTLGTVVAAAGMAGWRLSMGAVTVGEAVSLVVLGMMLIDPLSQIGRFFYVGAIGRAAASQVRHLLGLSDGVMHADPRGDDAIEQGAIRFDGVGLTYPDGGTGVVDLTFAVEPGERLALVGPSGAGKTTIAHLVLGLLEPTEGMVEVGGPAVLVPQRPFLFHGSIAENLRIARADATDSELYEALAAAGLDDLVSTATGGLDIEVGERGLRLSGGEVQRLAIARALLVDAPVIVLDEPTSNVDLDTEARIREALDRLTAGRTVVIIAHRRSTIRGSDRVLAIDRGRLARADDASDGVRPDQSDGNRP
jgi:ATP-binding cassette, subfamily C, bacterial CydD